MRKNCAVGTTLRCRRFQGRQIKREQGCRCRRDAGKAALGKSQEDYRGNRQRVESRIADDWREHAFPQRG